jgi:hypothetical protein
MLAATLAVAPSTATGQAGPVTTAQRTDVRDITFTRWEGANLGLGKHRGTAVVDGNHIAIGTPTGKREYGGRTFERGRWSAPWVDSTFGLTQLIASWQATTPAGSWIEIEVRGRTPDAEKTSWDVLGRWTSDATIQRRTLTPQSDDLASVNVDTWVAKKGAGFSSWQLRVSLFRMPGTVGPSVTMVGAVASRLPKRPVVNVSPFGPTVGTSLPVPTYSQMVHKGDFPQWGGGGEAWCSPTSTSMVLGYYNRLPTAPAYRFVPKGHPAPWVDYAARQTYDFDYEGTGNWPFNTAYAAGLAGHAFVTRLRSLTEAEAFIAAGIPLVASVSWGPGELTGAPVASSDGHLLVIAGFTSYGDVVVNDPAFKTAEGVRTIYDREQFENAWLPKSGGTVYVIYDDAHPLPAPPAQANW